MNGCSPFVKENYCTVVACFDVQPEIQSTLFSFELGQGPPEQDLNDAPLLVPVRGTPNWHMSVALCSFQWDLMREIQDAYCRCCSQTMRQKEVPSHGPLENWRDWSDWRFWSASCFEIQQCAAANPIGWPDTWENRWFNPQLITASFSCTELALPKCSDLQEKYWFWYDDYIQVSISNLLFQLLRLV